LILCVTAVSDRNQLLQAQSVPAPAVRIQRDYALNDRVWPVDLNRDGITDLVSSSGSHHLQVSIGRGDGTFQAPVESSFQGYVLNTGDFNGDGRPDVIAASQTFDVAILPGTGTATLGAAVPVGSRLPVNFEGFAISADFDGDGRRDLVLPVNFALDVLPGNGDFTFGGPIAIGMNGPVTDAIAGDLNNDGRLDIVAVNGEGITLTILLNRGSLAFAATDTVLFQQLNDVTLADINRDGRLDLFLAAGRPARDSGPGIGHVLAFRGNGDGTFAEPVSYDVLPGPMQIVAGDFNRDGIIDIATGNRSSPAIDDCSNELKTWDSVSVLTGRSDGTLVLASSFSVGDQSLPGFDNAQLSRYTNTLVSLNTSDLNGDRATDLIVSNGAILLNIPAVPNRPPKVNAGPDIVKFDTDVFLPLPASDPDEDVLTYEVRDAAGHVRARYPNACIFVGETEPQTFTVTVDDGHGHTASDSVTVTLLTATNPVGRFPDARDIGQVAAAGSSTFDDVSGTYTIRGSGRDIWDNADEFQFAWELEHGDFQITARVDDIQNVNVWTKAGIMIRENLNTGARHASLFATPARGLSFQRRTTANGPSILTAGPAITAPVWLRLVRGGDTITAFWRLASTDAWTMIDRQTLPNLPQDVLVGLAVTSHADGVLASARFSNVAFEIPPSFSGQAIGSGSGFFAFDGFHYTVIGKGVDIWATTDSFFFVAASASGDITITARVQSLVNTDVWAKAGVMIRDNLSPGSAHVMVAVTPGRGVSMQYRPFRDQGSARIPNDSGVAPAWVRLSKQNGSNIFVGSWSTDGEHWTVLQTLVVNFTGPFFWVGLPVSSHNVNTATTAVFDQVKISPFLE
jgi:hypothetical protein